MERYGGSSTPTFVFIDRSGIVRFYTPTRLTEEAFDRALATITK
jgi:thioredoxin-related protein